MTEYETSRVKGQSYYIEVEKENSLMVSYYWYPIDGAANFVGNHLRISLTPKRAIVKDWTTRDNWNGSGWSDGDKEYFENRKEVKQLIEDGKKVLALPNDEDKDYEIMKFVSKVFRDYSNIMLSEDMEEAIDA